MCGTPCRPWRGPTTAPTTTGPPRGAAYGVWCAATGHTPRTQALTQVSDSFRGTLYSKVLLPDSPRDAVYLAGDVTVRAVDCDGVVTDSLYDLSKLEQKDQYTVFQGGNWARVTVDTGVKNGRHLLLVKDSFANSFVPFLAGDYETITMLDLRFFGDSVEELMDRQGITDVLVLYELSNFAAERDVFKLHAGQ